MEDNFNHDEFEEFLQDQVKNHRMYPSDAVWREIDKNLHGEKRWPALTIAATSLVSITVIICIYFTPKTDIFSIPTVNESKKIYSQKTNILNHLNSTVPFTTSPDKTSATYNEPAVVNTPAASVNLPQPAKSILVPNNPVIKASDAASFSTQIISKRTGLGNTSGLALLKGNKATTPTDNTHETTAGLVNNPSAIIITGEEPNVQKKISTFPNAQDKERIYKNPSSSYSDNNSDAPVYSARKRAYSKSKFAYQIYIAPSVSYRKLLEDNSVGKENSGGPVGINYITDVNKVVRHKPGTGIEAGISFLYSLSPTVRIKSGFQFNLRQYSIEAYRSNTELASIALTGNNRLDTINTLAIYRTNNGYYSTNLVNRYYQVSMPIGIEWEVLGNRLIQLNVAGTIQPTYLLNRNAYLLTTNFKNYTESPGMVRQWNLNSNIEAFVSVKSGDFKWQLGPQLRYQPYSTFIPEYSIKEHLLDYGVKLGVSKTIR